MKAKIISILAYILLRLIYKTINWKIIYKTSLQDIDAAPRIIVFWHGKQLPLAPFFKTQKVSRPFYMLISKHRDGQLISNAVKYFGIKTVAGSSSKGGVHAAKELIDKLNEGCHVAITPDGPRGPRLVAKEGAQRIAENTGFKIVPVSWNINRKWVFGSWDKMELPKPFSKGTIIVGEPVEAAEVGGILGGVENLSLN